MIGRQRIFNEATLNQLEGLIDIVSRRILDGTTTAEQFVADECHVDGGGTHTHQERTAEAEALSRALPCLIDLREHLHAVFDLMHAIRALDELRQRI